MTDKWIGNSKPWRPSVLDLPLMPPAELNAKLAEYQAAWGEMKQGWYRKAYLEACEFLKEEAGRANKVEMPDILPKEPQWRPTDGEGLEYGDWPGYLHADDFRP